MSTPLEKENLRPIFGKIMKIYQLRPEEVAVNQAKANIFNEGRFECERCDPRHKWVSRFSWVTFDLSKLEIVKRWKMLCRNCHGECYPKFEVDQLEEMFKKAVLLYLKPKSERIINIGYGARKNLNKPHLPELCEKCGYVASGYYCWNFYFNC